MNKWYENTNVWIKSLHNNCDGNTGKRINIEVLTGHLECIIIQRRMESEIETVTVSWLVLDIFLLIGRIMSCYVKRQSSSYLTISTEQQYLPYVVSKIVDLSLTCVDCQRMLGAERHIMSLSATNVVSHDVLSTQPSRFNEAFVYSTKVWKNWPWSEILHALFVALWCLHSLWEYSYPVRNLFAQGKTKAPGV